ncbi:MAG TPA: hypothetical protein VL309_07000 [Vicinamibacterales bacterium]|jgi:hypothetical protein|nr:hypothetical protein [Vicinamibacterales bacterium]
MTTALRSRVGVLTAVLVFAGALAAPAAGQPRDAVAVDQADARAVRDQLQTILEQYPPPLGQVLRLDPTLLGRPDYLAPYPALAAILAQHPEIAHAPAYFFGEGRVRDSDARMIRTMNLVEEVLGGLAFLFGFTIFVFSMGWLVRTALADRRWQRLTRIQTETHSKLLDRMSTHEDLAAYIQSPQMRRFLESPAPIDAGPSPVQAPLGRILWSTQAGVILAAVGLGLLAARHRVPEELGVPLSVVGIVAIALGIGFLASALAAYLLSLRLGLLGQPRTHDA